jgi:hypothetical protein
MFLKFKTILAATATLTATITMLLLSESLLCVEAKTSLQASFSSRTRRHLQFEDAPSVPPSGLPVDLNAVAVEAYDFGYPLVLEAVTGLGFFLSEPNLTLNEFFHRRQFPPPEDKGVIHYNLDTLYSTAFLDVSDVTGLELSIPATDDDQYWLMQVMDGWTNVIANPGSRTTGNKAQSHLIVGPKGVPSDVNTAKYDSVIKSPTNLLWIIGRTLVRNGKVQDVWPIQDGYKLTAVQTETAPTSRSSFQQSVLPDPQDERLIAFGGFEAALSAFNPLMSAFAQASVDAGASPPSVVSKLTGEQYFSILSLLMCENPALLPQDVDVLKLFEHIGFKPCKPFVIPSFKAKSAVSKAPATCVDRYKRMTLELGSSHDGWRIILEDMGRFGDNYPVRAVVAFSFIGANLPEDAVYPETHVDGNGDALYGEKSYTLTFAPNALPPVEAFWSITMYDIVGYFIVNPDAPIQRFSLSSASSTPPIVRQPDGSLRLIFQSQKPKDDKLVNNWIPTKAGVKFALNMRLYSPSQDILSLKWTPPAVQLQDTPL